jgi:hypothetical protein
VIHPDHLKNQGRSSPEGGADAVRRVRRVRVRVRRVRRVRVRRVRVRRVRVRRVRVRRQKTLR